MPAAAASCGSRLVGVIPVSYTHLDVYKRQEITFLDKTGKGNYLIE